MNEDKRALRRALKERRKDLGDTARRAAADEMVKQVLNHPAFRAARTVLGYYPIREEPNLVSLWKETIRQGKILALPRCENGVMRFYKVVSLETLTLGAYGIFEPPSDAEEILDFSETLCIVPALSVDREGTRLGYGGGYYDRFLAAHRSVDCICCLYEELLFVCPLPKEDFDVSITTVITQKGERKLHEA